MSMSYTPSPLYPSASQPTRRDRMASALRTLMTNDNLDPEILRAGTQWMTALEEFTQTFTPQATFQPASAQTNLPLDINTTPIDLALCTGSSFPLESGPSSTNPVQSWLGDIFSRPSLSNNLPAHLMGCDFTLGEHCGHKTAFVTYPNLSDLSLLQTLHGSPTRGTSS